MLYSYLMVFRYMYLGKYCTRRYWKTQRFKKCQLHPPGSPCLELLLAPWWSRSLRYRRRQSQRCDPPGGSETGPPGKKTHRGELPAWLSEEKVAFNSQGIPIFHSGSSFLSGSDSAGQFSVNRKSPRHKAARRVSRSKTESIGFMALPPFSSSTWKKNQDPCLVARPISSRQVTNLIFFGRPLGNLMPYGPNPNDFPELQVLLLLICQNEAAAGWWGLPWEWSHWKMSVVQSDDSAKSLGMDPWTSAVRSSPENNNKLVSNVLLSFYDC